MARACAPARGGQALRLRAGMRRARARARVAWCMYKGVRALALHCRKRHCFVSSSMAWQRCQFPKHKFP